MNLLTALMGRTDQRSIWTRDMFTFGGRPYPFGFQQTLIGDEERLGEDLAGLSSGGYAGNGVVFACLNARLNLFNQARPMFRRLRSGMPGELYSTAELEILRTPWRNGNTADLLSRMIQYADLGGAAPVAHRPGRLAVLRPDWTIVVHGSRYDTGNAWDPDAEVIGYLYQPGGPAGGQDYIRLPAPEVGYFCPTPDPLWPARGISWLTPIIGDIEADGAATKHKLMFFRQGATPNMVVTGVVPSANQTLKEWTDKWRAANEGVDNAYRTQFFTGTAGVQVVGKDLQQLDFRATQGAGEVRIANAAGVPATVVGLSEGLQGSSLNAGNFASSMRRFADLTGRPLWANAFGSLATIVNVPSDSELWYSDADIPALKDDIRDAAEVQMKQAEAIARYVVAGFEPATAVDAINAGDLKRLVHTGLYSVQLQPPQPGGPPQLAPATPGSNAMAEVAMRAIEALSRPPRAADANVTSIVYDDGGRIVEIVEGDA